MDKKNNIDNVNIRRRYERILGDLEGYAKSTVRTKVDDVGKFDEFLEGKDFRKLNEDMAIKYKNHLKGLMSTEKPIQLKTVHGKLLSVIEFYNWLRKQPGYKRRVKESAIQCFRLSRKETNSIATQINLIETPNLDQILELVDSIKGDTEVGMRDKGIFSLTLLTGIRVKSLTMLRLKDFDRKRLILTLNPLDDVDTKFGETMNPVIVPLDDNLLNQFIYWFDYLQKVKGFTPENPLFPKTEVKQMEGSLSYTATTVTNKFWKSPTAVNKIFKDRIKAAGLSHFTPHSLRHALVQIFISLNPTEVEKLALSQNLGHKSPVTTYGQYAKYDVNKRSEILSKENLQNIINRSSWNINDALEQKIDLMNMDLNQKYEEILKHLLKNINTQQ